MLNAAGRSESTEVGQDAPSDEDEREGEGEENRPAEPGAEREGDQADGRADEAHEPYVMYVLRFEHIYRVGSGAAGGEHRVADDDDPVLYIERELAVIFNGFMSFGISVKTYVTDLCDGYEGQKSVHHAETGAEYRYYGELFAGDDLCRAARDGRFDLHVFKRQIARELIAHEHGDLIKQFTEFL